jgi:ankyrin repeat protein
VSTILQKRDNSERQNLQNMTEFKPMTLFQNMKIKLLITGICLVMTTSLVASTNDLSGLLQKGLFEEEANRNLDAATAAYQTLVTQFDKDRQIGATAIFRLGEVYRKQGKTNEAAAQYERIVRDFAEQTTLATLSRQNLAGLGAAQTKTAATQPAPQVQSPEALELERSEKILAQLSNWDLPQLRKLIPTLVPDAEFERINQQLSGSEALGYKVDPQIQHQRAEYHLQLQKRAEEIMVMLERRVKILREQVAKQNAADKPSQVVDQSPINAGLDDEEAGIRRIKAMIQNGPDLINGSPSFESPLITAAREGRLRAVRFLLDKGAKINVTSGGKTALHSAAQTGNRAMLELLLERGADVNARDGSEVTALHYAARDGFLSIVELLLKYKADAGARNSKMNGEETPLHLAAKAGHTATVKILVVNGANVNDKDSSGDTPLQEAVARGHHDTAAALLNEKASVETTNNDGRTPLHAAAEAGHLDMLKLLLERRANVNARDEQQATPLLFAVHKQHATIVETLLDQGADPNLPGQAVKATGIYPPNLGRPIEFAASGSNTNILLSLLEHGADIEGCETPGWRPLFRAIEAGNVSVVELLLAHKADPNLPDSGDAVPLERGLKNPLIVKLLLSAGADPNPKRKNGWPLTAQAITQATPEVLRVLLAFKADVNATTPNGWTALHFAVGQGNREMVELLLSHKPDVNARNDEGQTPLDLAKGIVKNNPSQSFRTIESLLQQHGALSNLPHFNSIRITRQGLEKPLVVYTKGVRLTNQFTLLETVMSFYAKPSAAINNKIFTPLKELPFPDFGRLIIRRPSAKTGGKEQEIKVSLLNVSNVVDCTKDVPVEFGDVIEIPERVHALDEVSADPVQEVETSFSNAKRKSDVARMMQNMIGNETNAPVIRSVKEGAEAKASTERWACLQKSVQLVVNSETTSFSVNSWKEGFLNHALAKSEARSALRSSSDLSRVKVTRKGNRTGKPIVMTVDATDTNDSLWLRDGDVIEVPDKP